MNELEIKGIESYLKSILNTEDIVHIKRMSPDAIEVYLKDRFIGIVYQEESEDLEGASYLFEVPIRNLGPKPH